VETSWLILMRHRDADRLRQLRPAPDGPEEKGLTPVGGDDDATPATDVAQGKGV